MIKPRSVVSILLMLTLLPIASIGLITRVAAAPPMIDLPAAREISSSPNKGVYPDIAVDTAGKFHIAWLEYASDNNSSRVLYTNNVGGSFIAPYEVSGSSGTNAEHILAIAVETNRVHVFYTGNGRSMHHRVVTLDGATPTRGAITQLSPGGARGYAPTATVDSSGRVHAAWIDNRSDTYKVYHRSWLNGWEGSDRPVRPNGGQQDRPSLAATDDGRVHVLLTEGTSPQYAIWTGSSWQQSNAPGGGGKSTNAAGLASDGTNVYAVWSITRSSDNQHVVNYNRGTNGNWGTAQVLNPDDFGDNPSIAFNRSNNKAYAIWTAGTARTILFREIDPNGTLSDIVRIGGGPSNWPMAGGGAGVGFVWQDKSSRNEKIMFTGVGGIQQPPQPVGSITVAAKFTGLLGGPGVTNPFDVTVTNTGGSATKVTLSVDGRELLNRDFSGSSMTFTGLSIDSVAQACERKTINGTLTGPGGTSQFSTQVWVDRAVNATVTLYDEEDDPAYDNTSFQLRIASGVDECSGLKSYSVNFAGTDAGPEASGNLFVTGEIVEVPLPTSLGEGPHSFSITLVDNAGMTASYQQSIIKDTTAPVATLEPGPRIPFSEDDDTDGFGTLTLSGLRADDNLYPDRGEGQGQEFYSVELVTKLASAGEPTPTEWSTYGVEITGSVQTPLSWNAALGLVGGFVPGEYRIYARVHDGAGNASNAFSTAQFELEQLNGQIYLPLLMR